MLGALVFGCIFPVKGAEADWRSVFMAVLFLAITLDMDLAILGVENLIILQAWSLHFSTLGPFWQLGDTLGDHMRSRKDTWESGTRFPMILG